MGQPPDLQQCFPLKGSKPEPASSPWRKGEKADCNGAVFMIKFSQHPDIPDRPEHMVRTLLIFGCVIAPSSCSVSSSSSFLTPSVVRVYIILSRIIKHNVLLSARCFPVKYNLPMLRPRQGPGCLLPPSLPSLLFWNQYCILPNPGLPANSRG